MTHLSLLPSLALLPFPAEAVALLGKSSRQTQGVGLVGRRVRRREERYAQREKNVNRLQLRNQVQWVF